MVVKPSTDSLGESQYRAFLLGWSKDLPSPVNNHSPFERELLDYSWAVKKTECLTVYLHVLM
jgi:hypothetical protein